MDKDKLKEVLRLHKLWLDSDSSGVRANLSSADLSSADLSYANLSSADLSSADLSYANLSDANLRYADLSDADLRYADLRYADLRSADLSYANLRSANLRDANLRDADLRCCIGNQAQVRNIETDKYRVSYTYTHLNIGCQSHLISDWLNFSDAQIAKMDSGALIWWNKYKPFILSHFEFSPATPYNKSTLK